MECEEELLDLHVLVADGVIALSDAEFPREARNSVFINADSVAARPGDRRSRRRHESANCRERDATYESAKRMASKHCACSRKDRKAWILKGFKMKDARHAHDGFEEKRKYEALAAVSSERGATGLSSSPEAQSPVHQQEGSTEACASDERGEYASRYPC